MDFGRSMHYFKEQGSTGPQNYHGFEIGRRNGIVSMMNDDATLIDAVCLLVYSLKLGCLVTHILFLK